MDAEDAQNLNEDYQEMQEFLSFQSDEVQENCRIVTPDMMGCEFALHVDKNTPGAFVPRMPRSAMPSENDTCPRVTVAGTVMGCYIGYFRGERDLQDGSFPRPGQHDPFMGGYHISRINFKHALWPNEKLVSDAHSSEELWLVPYNADNASYVPEKIGKMFVSELTFIPVSGHKPRVRLVVYVTHNEPKGLWFNREVKLEVGCYRAIVEWPSIWTRALHQTDGVTIEKVSQEAFDEAKKLTAAMLSRHVDALPNRPAYLSWE